MDDDTSRDVARLSTAAEHFRTGFPARFSTVRHLKPETEIACAARMAGTMLLRAAGDPNADCAKLIDILLLTLHAANHVVTEQDLETEDATAASQLSVPETRQLLDRVVLSYCRSAKLDFEDAAYALAVATALIVHDRRRMLDVRKGAAIAASGFFEGCKTAAAVVT